jgi:two-component system response regulator GlrR
VNSKVILHSARILVVEDQDDVRRMLVTALEIDGHQVDEADSALAGLRQLQQRRYNLVLSDYAMPGGTGTWMLHEANRLGLMSDTVALIITAHPDVRELVDVEVISKPLDLDFFLEQVRKLLVTRQAQRAPAASGNTSDVALLDHENDRSRPHKVELVLYVSSASSLSAETQRTIERLLTRFDASQVKFSVCDLEREPLAGDADRIAFTPTLVKKYPEPKMWLVGNLRNSEVLADLLRVAGVDAT